MITKLALGALMVITTSVSAFGQDANSPVSTGAREILARRQTNIVAAAESMPEPKYGYKPTPEQRSFGETVAHIAEHNYDVCSKIGGSQVPGQLPTAKDPKTKLVTGLRESFEFCSGAYAKLDDSMLAQTIELKYGGPTTKGRALLNMAGDWADHYAQMAMYLRLNGLLPPTAKK